MRDENFILCTENIALLSVNFFNLRIAWDIDAVKVRLSNVSARGILFLALKSTRRLNLKF